VNNQTIPVTSTILRNKLGRLAIRLQAQANPLATDTDFDTLEKTVAESVKILSQFYKQLSDPTYKPTNIVVDTVPDAQAFNENFIAIQDDLEIVFHEFENMEGVILGEFNYMVSRLNRLNRKLKGISSQLGDYILFSTIPTKDAIFYGDSFNNLSRVEVNSPLLNQDQCEVNQVEGIATLPVDRTAQVTLNVTELPVINSNSNGITGNNQEAGASLHGTLTDILDNNADTWFEYERVLGTDDGVALTLDFTINIGEEKIVNFIRINPNNFGSQAQVKIVSINTSVDGKDFVSVKDDIPIADFVIEDEDNVFTLAPSTSKYAGQGLYTFTPRLAKYVHLTLKQTTAYTITTATGHQKYRYAIGIRDIEVQALPYKDTGEIISTEFTLSDDVRKVVLLSNQNPSSETTSSLASIDHYVSPDNGVTWHQIRPKVSAGVANVDQAIPELLDFNGVSAGSIATANEVKSLRYKALMKRDTSAFTKASSELAQEIAENTELHSPPSTTPFTITLENTPVTGTLKLIDPQFGSRGKEEVRYQVANGNGNSQIILLPFKPLVRELEKYLSGGYWCLRDLDPEQIYVGGSLWTRVPVLSGLGAEYTLNYEEGRLEFGDGTNGDTVPDASSISMNLVEERISPSRGTDHLATLDYSTPQDQKQVVVAIVHPPRNRTDILARGATRFQLQADILYDSSDNESWAAPSPYKITFSDSSVFTTEKVFGEDVLAAHEWCIDWANGVLYSYDPTSSADETTISYSHNPRTILSDSDWAFQNAGNGIANVISIADDKYQTFTADQLDVEPGVKYFNLQYLNVVQGTINFTDNNVPEDDALKTEVQFIDGRSELLGVVLAAESLDPITTTGFISVSFKMKISSDAGFGVTFSKPDIFKVEKNSKADVDGGIDGDYWIDRTAATSLTGRIYVKLDSAQGDPGVVTYSYVNPQAVLTGRYSVNYETGEVFSYEATPSNITVDYEYTDYRAKYDIARLVSTDDWEFDSSTDKITIKDREILKNIRTPQQTGQHTEGSKFYQASYQYVKSTRANVSDLEPFFSPVLKDYALKVVTKSRLV